MPTPEEYLRPEVIQQVARLDLKARFILDGFLSGLHDSPYRGFSGEFSEHRRYNPGDELRNIDWNVFARTDRFYVKCFEAETSLYCYPLVDVSESMAYKHAGKVTKLEYCTYLAAALGYLMMNQGDGVGLVTFDEEIINFLPARNKRSHLLELLGLLCAGTRNRPSHLADSLHEVAELLPKRGLIILFSDLIPGPRGSERESQQQVIEALHHLRYRGHDVICFQVLDRAELEFPFTSTARLVDVESPRTRVKVEPQAVRQGYLREFGAFIERYRQECQRAEIDFTQVDTSVSFDLALMSYLNARRSHF